MYKSREAIKKIGGVANQIYNAGAKELRAIILNGRYIALESEA